MAQCTWQDPPDIRCPEEATVEQMDVSRKKWAHLCMAHDRELIKAIKDGNAQMILRNWIRAKGGPKAAAAQM